MQGAFLHYKSSQLQAEEAPSFLNHPENRNKQKSLKLHLKRMKGRVEKLQA